MHIAVCLQSKWLPNRIKPCILKSTQPQIVSIYIQIAVMATGFAPSAPQLIQWHIQIDPLKCILIDANRWAGW